jgi:hypothetical protein
MDKSDSKHDTALTLTEIALRAESGSQKRVRNTMNTVLRLSERTTFSDEEAQHLAHKLLQLRAALQQLGDVFAAI